MTSRKHRSRARAVVALIAVTLTCSLAASASAEIPPDVADNPLLQPLDEQNWVDQAELTWDDYTQIRPDGWNAASSSTGSQSQYKTAVILLQFQDQPFLITQPGGTHPFGNPQPGWQPVAPEEVADWYYDYYAVPNQYNGGQTIHGYWMEDSYGKIGVDLQVFGPYTLPGKLHEYGIPDGSFNAPAARYCPQGDSCNKSLRTDGERFGGPTSAALPGCAASTTASTSPPVTTSRRPGRSSARCSTRTATTSRTRSGRRAIPTAARR